MSRPYWMLAVGAALILVLAVLMSRPSSETTPTEVEREPVVTVNRSPT